VRVAIRCGKGGGPWGNVEAEGKGGREAPCLGPRRRSGAATCGVNHGFPHGKGKGRGVIPAGFEYERAGSLDEAIELLGREDAKVLAGGQSLIPLLRLRFARPSVLVDVGRLDDLRYVREDGDRIAIGALTRHSELVRDPVLGAECAVIPHAAEYVGDPQVRHRGTIGGSIAHGDPASDLSTILLTLDADLVAHGPDGERTIPAADFFVGPFMTALGPRDVLKEIRVPKVESGVYLKHNRRSQDWATVGVAAARVDGGVQVGLASMGGTPLRARSVEEALAGGASPADAAERAAEGAQPPADISGSSAYRAHLARVLVRRALEQL
jgi:carbon-monoxide dehydrogenase medium subunit